MILLTRTRRATWVNRGRTRELTDTAWRATLGLARVHGVDLGPTSAVTAVADTDAARLAAALEAARPTLTKRTVKEWVDGMMRVRAAGRSPVPAHYWSTRDDVLGELAAWIARGGFTVVRRAPPRPAVEDDEDE